MPGWTIEGLFPGTSQLQRRAIRLLALPEALLMVVAVFAQDAPQAQPQQAPGAASANPAPATAEQTELGKDSAGISSPIAIVPLETSNPNAGASVSGPIKAWNGRAIITSSGEISSGSATVPVTLPYRGALNVCANTKVNLSVDSSVPRSDVPGLLMALQSGALEASFAIVKDSDIVQTPDFRILISGPGAADVKVRLGSKGDTCVDVSGGNGPYVLVSSVFDGGIYRVQPGQRVLFQHGSLREVVDNEKEPCGCPPPATQGNEFPLAQSEGLAPPPKVPASEAVNKPALKQIQQIPPLVYNGAEKGAKDAPVEQPALKPAATAPPQLPPTPKPAPKKPGFFKRVGHFFGRIFGAE